MPANVRTTFPDFQTGHSLSGNASNASPGSAVNASPVAADSGGTAPPGHPTGHSNLAQAGIVLVALFVFLLGYLLGNPHLLRIAQQRVCNF